MATMLFDRSRTSGFRSISSGENVSMKSTVGCSNRLRPSVATTYRPISDARPYSSWSSRIPWTSGESWLTQLIGSDSSLSDGSSQLPTTKIATDTTAMATAVEGGSLPSHTTNRPNRPSLKSFPWVGDRYSRMPRMASGLMIDEMQMAMMPTVSSQPN